MAKPVSKDLRMSDQSFSIDLTPTEEKIAQMLTRDAWGYFSSQISHRDLFHIKEIPMMPRRGSFEIVNDAELLQYYLEFAHSYTNELGLLGWSEEQSTSAADSFVVTLQAATGVHFDSGKANTAG